MRQLYDKLVQGLKTIFLVLFMYTFSISLTFYNKWLIKRFQFPLMLSVIHYIVVFLGAAAVRLCWEFYKGKRRIILQWKVYIIRVLPAAFASAIDIGLSNWSFEFITVSLYTMTKTTSIIFITMFAIIFKLEKPNAFLGLVVLCISGGLFMFTYESTQFNLTGFIIILSASAMSGVRWSLSQILMQKSSLGLGNPFDAIYHMQPLMALSLIPFAFGIEGHSMAMSTQLFRAPDSQTASVTVLMVLFGAFLAFMLNVSEFWLLSNTSSLTLAVAGIFKEICTLSIATEFGGDKMNILKFIGLCICLLGIILHIIYKAVKGPQIAQEFRIQKFIKESQSDWGVNGESMQMLLRRNSGQTRDSDDSEEEIYAINR